MIVQIMISLFIYLFFCFKNYRFIIQRLWTSKVLKESLEISFFFSGDFGVSFMLGKNFQFRIFFLKLPNFLHQTFLFDGIPQKFFLWYLIFYTKLFLFDVIPHYTLNTLNNIFLHLVFPRKYCSRKLKIVGALESWQTVIVRRIQHSFHGIWDIEI